LIILLTDYKKLEFELPVTIDNRFQYELTNELKYIAELQAKEEVYTENYIG